MNRLKQTACDYCGLPVAGWQRASGRSGEPLFCCFGCRLAARITAERGEEAQARWMLTRLGLSVFCAMNVVVFTLALWSPDIYSIKPWSGTAATSLFELLRHACLVLAGIVVLLLGGPLLESAIDDLRARRLTTDLLILIGVAASYFYSVLAVVFEGEHVYFEVTCMVLVAMTFGRWLEASGKLRTRRALDSFEKLLPSEVRRLAGDGQQETVPLEQVKTLDLLRILPGERIPVDGVLCGVPATVDEQLVSGESQLVVKEDGDKVYAGTLLVDVATSIKVTVPPESGTLQRMITAVTEAALSKGELRSASDRATAWFIPLLVTIALVAAAVHGFTHGTPSAILVGLSVLLIGCPCALGIAMPMAVSAAVGRGARGGVLFRNADAIASLASARVICFDKTGTLTTGVCAIEDVVIDCSASEDEIMRRTAAAAGGSTHSFSSALRRYTDAKRGLAPFAAGMRVETHPGRGLVAIGAEGDAVTYLGSPRFMQESGLLLPDALEQRLRQVAARRSVVCIGWDGLVRAIWVLGEQWRPEVVGTLGMLERANLQVRVLTGDLSARAGEIAAQLDCDVQAGLLPDGKQQELRRLRERFGPTAMVGDGINDAPALAAADVGIAMGCGADLSRDAASVCLVGDDLTRIPWAIDLAKRTQRVVRQNLCWAFVYNTAGIGLAAAGLLNPIWAALAMVGSSLFVISNSLQLASGGSTTDEATFDSRSAKKTPLRPQPT